MFKFLAELFQTIFSKKRNKNLKSTFNDAGKEQLHSQSEYSKSDEHHNEVTKSEDVQGKNENKILKSTQTISEEEKINSMIDEDTSSLVDKMYDQKFDDQINEVQPVEKDFEISYEQKRIASKDNSAAADTEETDNIKAFPNISNKNGIDIEEEKHEKNAEIKNDEKNINSHITDSLNDTKFTDDFNVNKENLSVEEIQSGTETELQKVNASEVNSEYEIVHFDFNDPDSIISYLSNKINSHKLIGYDLLQIESKGRFKNHIHNLAIKYLKHNYDIAPNLYSHREVIIISLTLIALDQYDGNYWDAVRSLYSPLYKSRSEQKVDAMIRRIIAYYSEGDHRYINFVIRQAIIPKHYLDDFISFCFDIYSDTLKYELIDNLNDVLTNVYLDVSNAYENENTETDSEIKTYGLIKTIKDIINNINWFGELIAYTKVILAYLDAYYWNDENSIEDLPYKTYLDPYIKAWIAKHNDIFIKETDRQRSSDTNWKAYYKLSGKDIYLHIPDTIIRNIYDPKTIRVLIYNDSETLFEINNPVVTAAFGGYKLSGISVKINNPLGKVKYLITAEDKLIEESKDNLYREYITFKEDGSELKKNETYTGNIDIAAKSLSKIEGVSIYFKSSNYELGNYQLGQFDALNYGNGELTLSASKVVKVEEEVSENVIIKTHHHTYPLNKEINQISFSIEAEPDDLELTVNNNHYHIRQNDAWKKNNIYQYYLPIRSYIKDGFNFIKIINRKTSQIIFSKKYFVDRSFKATFTQLGETIHLKLETCFINSNDFDADMDKDELFSIPFENEYYEHTLYMQLKPSIYVYRINEGEWHLFNDEISIKDINTYGKLWINGPSFDRVALVNLNGRINQPFQINKSKGKYYINTDLLMQYVGKENDQLLLLFYRDGIVADVISVYYKVVLKENDLSIEYDDMKLQATIHFSYHGKDKITVSIINGTEVMFSQNVQRNPADLKIDNIQPLHAYKILIEGGEDDLFSIDSNKYTIYEQEVSFYSRSELVGRSFNVKKCWGEHFNKLKQDWKEITQPVNNTTVTFLTREGPDEFAGEIQYLNNEIVLNKKVDIELTSEISEGKFWCSIKEEGDFLLYDFDMNTVVFDEENTDHKNDLPISEYRMEYFAENSAKQKI